MLRAQCPSLCTTATPTSQPPPLTPTRPPVSCRYRWFLALLPSRRVTLAHFNSRPHQSFETPPPKPRLPSTHDWVTGCHTQARIELAYRMSRGQDTNPPLYIQQSPYFHNRSKFRVSLVRSSSIASEALELHRATFFLFSLSREQTHAHIPLRPRKNELPPYRRVPE